MAHSHHHHCHNEDLRPKLSSDQSVRVSELIKIIKVMPMLQYPGIGHWVRHAGSCLFSRLTSNPSLHKTIYTSALWLLGMTCWFRTLQHAYFKLKQTHLPPQVICIVASGNVTLGETCWLMYFKQTPPPSPSHLHYGFREYDSGWAMQAHVLQTGPPPFSKSIYTSALWLPGMWQWVGLAGWRPASLTPSCWAM